MRITLKRKFKSDTYTIGDLFLNDEFFCNTIEDRVRELPVACPDTPKWKQCRCKEKVYAKTAIPTGTYKVTLGESPRFKCVLPTIHDVPHFLGVLIHTGNSEEDSAGCIIVGMNTQKGKVLQSKVTMTKLMERLENEKDITIEIV